MTLEVNPAQLDRFLSNIETNCRRRCPQFQPHPPREGKYVLIGGGPSINDHVETIRTLWADSYTVALNNAVEWMVDRKMRPNASVMMEIDAWPEGFLRPERRVTYYLSSFAAPETYKAIRKAVQWHADAPGMDIVLKHHRDALFLSCVWSNAAVTSLTLGLWLGYREFEAFGVDCSFVEQSHAYEHVEEDRYQADRIVRELEGRSFTTTQVLWTQAREMLAFCQTNQPKLRIHGDGMLPFAHRLYFKESYRDA